MIGSRVSLRLRRIDEVSGEVTPYAQQATQGILRAEGLC